MSHPRATFFSSPSAAQSLGFSSPDELQLASRLLADVSSQGPLFARALSGRAPRATDAERARIDEHCVEIPRAMLGDLHLGVDSGAAREVALALTEWALKEPGLFFSIEPLESLAIRAPASAAGASISQAPSLAKFRAAQAGAEIESAAAAPSRSGARMS